MKKNKSLIFLLVNIGIVLIRKAGIAFLYFVGEFGKYSYKIWQVIFDEFSIIFNTIPDLLFKHPYIYIHGTILIVIFTLVLFTLIIISLVKKRYDNKIQIRFIILTIIHFVSIFLFWWFFIIQTVELR